MERYYSGNNGQLGFIAYNGATSPAWRSPTSCSTRCSSKGRGSLTSPWTHLQNRIAVYAADDFKVTNALTLNLGLRWGYTSPLVEKDDRQANIDLTNAELRLAGQNGNSRALYEPYYNGWEPRIGLAYRAGERWVFRGGYGITQYMEGTGANLRLPLNPPFFFESQSTYDATSGAEHHRHRLRRPAGARPAVRRRPRLGSEPAAAVHPAVEPVRRIPDRLAVVDQHRLRRQQVEVPGDADRRQPAAARRRQPEHVDVDCSQRRPLFRVQPG